jgi:molecular chaperone GrpE
LTSETQENIEPALEEVGYEHPEAGQEIDLVAERTADLQRVAAEFANFRKQVLKDRALDSEKAVASVLRELLPLLDGLDRAAEHEELTGGFKAIADQLTSITTRLGLEKFGEVGTEFDPQIHDGLAQEISNEVSEPVVSKILQPGYKFKEKLLRPASVVVTNPAGE